MSLFRLFVPTLLLALTFSRITASISNDSLVESSCPLNFHSLVSFASQGTLKKPSFIDVVTQCQNTLRAIHFVRSQYLRAHDRFLPPLAAAVSCTDSFSKFLGEHKLDFDIKSSCGYNPKWISQSCRNMTSRAEFESLIPDNELQEVGYFCNRSLESIFSCHMCNAKLLSVRRLYLQGKEDGYDSDCSGYLQMYTAAFVNKFGPTDRATAKCLFSLEFLPQPTGTEHRKSIISAAVIGCVIGLSSGITIIFFLLTRHRKYARDRNDSVMGNDSCSVENHSRSTIDDSSLVFGFGLYGRSTNLVKFKIEEIKRATMNFSRENLIGKGGYGNVYKGILPDGSKVALKRFKNCSAAGDANFVHEVEMIASVRHVNLVALRGYCTAAVPMEGHQRIIVCDLMPNGSLYDHLFGCKKSKLSWPIRQKITLGTARGLAYLHHGVHPAIIHRDIKASNILLDETFEPKVADFGLAMIRAAGATHLSTMVAGTFGYVAPEYALYGKLTERSDVYSFGVLLLEILSGRKAYENNEGKVLLLADWAWELAKEGKALDVIEKDLPELSLPQVMEQYVILAVLCCHPILHCRPTMDQIVKVLEFGFQVDWTLGAYTNSN